MMIFASLAEELNSVVGGVAVEKNAACAPCRLVVHLFIKILQPPDCHAGICPSVLSDCDTRIQYVLV